MTRPYAEVIGDPIAHSKSSLIHRFWLDRLGIDADYRAVRVAPSGLAEYFGRRRENTGWLGCNVTIPHKVDALDHVADPGGLRTSIGALNTVFRGADGDPIATNTDAAGFYSPIAGLALAGAPVAMIGAGGAARAVLFALAKLGVGRVTLLNRSVLKGAALLASFGLKGDALPLDARLPPVRLLVNASVLGMTGQPLLVPDLDRQNEDLVVYDLVYSPVETALLAAARARGLETVDGLEMLVAQAALAFELFFGVEPPRTHDNELRALLTA